jgi:hypothetical protein
MPHKDPEAKRKYLQEWRAKNPDKVQANDLRDRPRQKAYREARRGQYAEYQRVSRMKDPKGHLLAQAKMRAKRDGLPFDISIDTLLWPTHCPVLGIELCYDKAPLARREGWKNRSCTATLDRHVNELGYVVGNVNVISHRANRIKSDATAEELMAVARYAAGLPPHLNRLITKT